MSDKKLLEKFGWNKFFQDQLDGLETDLVPARVVRHYGVLYHLQTVEGEIKGKISGKLSQESNEQSDIPVIGDWVLIDSSSQDLSLMKNILKRKSKISRQTSGEKIEKEQVIAANIDILLIVTGLDENYNLRRIERFLMLASEGGVKPILIFNKMELVEDLEQIRSEVEAVAPNVPQVFTSAEKNLGIDDLKKYLKKGLTFSFVGSTGVGKSSIINNLLGEEILKTQEVRKGAIGRHTTTHKELFLLPSGAMVIDTPGMREVGMWGSSEDGEKQTKKGKNSFEDIKEFAIQCKFNDCNHETEPGCAVKAALERGEIETERFESFKKLGKEMEYIKRKSNKSKSNNTKRRWKHISKEIKKISP